MQNRRVTQQTIAELAGVHRTTVSLALKGHPSIPEETRRRILEIVEETGYAPDPMLSALAVYRNSARPVHFHGTLAWLVTGASSTTWGRNLHFKEYYAGAAARARQHGYELETFILDTEVMTARRLASILNTRNISGILVCPQQLPHTKLDFPFESFCSVTFGYSLEEPRLHTVTAAHYRRARQTIQEIWRRGYRRIGLVGLTRNDSKVDDNYLAAYLAESFLLTGKIMVPPLYTEVIDAPLLDSWFKKHRPDAFITNHPDIMKILPATEIKFPEVGIGFPGLPGPHAQLAGVIEETKTIGAVAVDFLVSLIQHGQRGLPQHQQRIHVEGTWNEGRSLRPPP